MTRVLVAGIGNVFFRDDGFGVAVAGRLAGRELPAGVVVEDYGIRGLHLAYELSHGYDALVLVDAMALEGEPPGTVVVLEPADLLAPTDPGGDPGGVLATMDAHTVSPATVLATMSQLGGTVGRVLVVGCKPATTEQGMGLSDPVASAVNRAVEIVSELLDELVGERPAGRETGR